jgi:hypothetical protein
MTTMNSTTIQNWIDEKTQERDNELPSFIDYEICDSWENEGDREEFLESISEKTVFIQQLKKELKDALDREEVIQWYESKYGKVA